MSCTGCEHGAWIESDALKKLMPGYAPPDPDALFPDVQGDPAVNSINPGAAIPAQPPSPWVSYPTPKDHPPTFEVSEDPNVVDPVGTDRTVSITLHRFWVTGWHGSCGSTSSGCEEVDSCVYRIYLRWRVKVTNVVGTEPGVQPQFPAMPTIDINSTAPSTVTGTEAPGLRLRIPGDDPDWDVDPQLPPDEVGVVTQENGNPLPTVTNAPGASVGLEYAADGTAHGYRDYYVEAVYKSVPGCNVEQSFEIELDDWAIVIDGETVSDSAPSWNIIDEWPRTSDDNIDVTVTCWDCEQAVQGPPSPPPEDEKDPNDTLSHGQSEGRNANPDSIGP